jgi:hypothetical protein
VVDVGDAMAQLGGVAHVRTLVRLTSTRQIRAAIASGDLVRVGRGRYRTKTVDKAFARALELRGMVSHLSAAAHYGWEMPYEPHLPWVSVPRNRQVPKPRRAHVVWADLNEESGYVTSELRTVVDCARRCEFAVALSVADSAIRARDVDLISLTRAAGEVRGKGAAQARRVAGAATGLPANAFESALLAFALDAGLSATPQVEIVVEGVPIHPDVVDLERRVVLEEDSWEFHGTKEAFKRDCWRYTALAVDGWVVLRFTWWQVMENPDWVRACLSAVARRTAVGANAA